MWNYVSLSRIGAGSGVRLVGGVRCQQTGNIHAQILASQEFHQDGIDLKDGEDNIVNYFNMSCSVVGRYATYITI